jgi:hypothetical protein
VTRFNDELDSQESHYQTISIVTHGTGALLVMRALLDRHYAYPAQRQHRIHRILLFAPPTVSLLSPSVASACADAACKLPGCDEYTDLVRKLDAKELKSHETTLTQIQRELRTMQQQGSTSADRRRLYEKFLGHIFVVRGENDLCADAICTPRLRSDSACPWQLTRQSFLDEVVDHEPDSPQDVVTRFATIAGSGHNDLVESARSSGVNAKPLSRRFQQLLWERLRTPPGPSVGDREQVVQATNEWVRNRLYDMNKAVLSMPEVGTSWDAIERAINEGMSQKSDRRPHRSREWADVVLEPEDPQRDPERNLRDRLIKRMYYTYIFLDIYQRMDDLAAQGLLAPSDPPYREWRQDWIPDLMRSRIGRWMQQKDLLLYYSSSVQNQIERATRMSPSQLKGFVDEAARIVQNQGLDAACKVFSVEQSKWRHGDTYVFILDENGIIRCHGADAKRVGISALADEEFEIGKRVKYAFDSMGIGSQVAKPPSHGWMFYLWHRPAEDASIPVWKASYLKKARTAKRTYVVGSGVFDMNVDEEILTGLLELLGGWLQTKHEPAVPSQQRDASPHAHLSFDSQDLPVYDHVFSFLIDRHDTVLFRGAKGTKRDGNDNSRVSNLSFETMTEPPRQGGLCADNTTSFDSRLKTIWKELDEKKGHNTIHEVEAPWCVTEDFNPGKVRVLRVELGGEDYFIGAGVIPKSSSELP